MNFYPILINYQFEKGNFVFDFIDQQKIKPDPNSNREFYNKVNCGSILLDDEMKFSLLILKFLIVLKKAKIPIPSQQLNRSRR